MGKICQHNPEKKRITIYIINKIRPNFGRILFNEKYFNLHDSNFTPGQNIPI